MVTRIEFASKWKTHLSFCGLFIAAVVFSVGENMFAGEHFSQAAVRALQGIKPLEVIMFWAFWYVLAFYRPRDESRSSFTSLNPGSKDENP